MNYYVTACRNGLRWSDINALQGTYRTLEDALAYVERASRVLASFVDPGAVDFIRFRVVDLTGELRAIERDYPVQGGR